MSKTKQQILIESDDTRDWLEYVTNSSKRKEYRLTEEFDSNGKKKLNYDIKNRKKGDIEININVLKFPYKFSKLKIKNYYELTDSICEQVIKPKNYTVKKNIDNIDINVI